MNREKKEKKSIMPGVIIAAFVAAIGTFFLLLNVEKNALAEYEQVEVWRINCELAKGVEITPASLEEYVEQVTIEKSKMPQRAVMDPQTLIGKQTLVVIPIGTILTDTLFRDEEEYISEMQKPVIAGCKGEDLFQLVSGVLRKGDRVHIYTVNTDLEETYLLWENIVVYQAFDSAGNMIAGEDTTTPATRVNLLLEEGFAEQFYNELNNGSLRVVKVWD